MSFPTFFLLLVSFFTISYSVNLDQRFLFKLQKATKATCSGSGSSSSDAVDLDLVCTQFNFGNSSSSSGYNWSSKPLYNGGLAGLIQIFEGTDHSGVRLNQKPVKNPKTEHRDSTGLVWVDASTANVSKIQGKVEGGKDADGQVTYICRSVDPASPNMMPGKFSPRQGVCVVSWIPDMVFTAHYQVLTNPDAVKLSWVPDSHGHVPPKAWFGGYLRQHGATSYYLGRAHYKGSLEVGKINVRQKNLLMAYYRKTNDYSALKGYKSHPEYFYYLKNHHQARSTRYEVLVVDA